MQLVKERNEFGLNVILLENGKRLGFTFSGNGDLYWFIHSKDDKSFTITCENYALYNLFLTLYNDIDNINIYDMDDIGEIIFDKRKYLLYNYGNYDKLFSRDDRKITWYSDETYYKVANYFEIEKDDDSFRIGFYTQKHIGGYDRDFNSLNYIPVRIRNSGSFYAPFNVIFMRMYNKLREIDDVYDIGHQIHMEEYLYEKKRKLTP